jgi:hypothetical protein
VPVENVKHGKHDVARQPGYSFYGQNGPLQITVTGAEDLNNADFTPGRSFLGKLSLMVGNYLKRELNRVVFFPGSAPMNIVITRRAGCE